MLSASISLVYEANLLGLVLCTPTYLRNSSYKHESRDYLKFVLRFTCFVLIYRRSAPNMAKDMCRMFTCCTTSVLRHGHLWNTVTQIICPNIAKYELNESSWVCRCPLITNAGMWNSCPVMYCVSQKPGGLCAWEKVFYVEHKCSIAIVCKIHAFHGKYVNKKFENKPSSAVPCKKYRE